MKTLISFVSIFLLWEVGFTTSTTAHPKHLLGSKECTWGPSYWCQNLTAAANCHATKHCIQTDWMHRTVEPDNSNICQTCLDMVKQARDQLLSNETQDLIKQVFEGTCNLTHFKPIVKECDKIVDNFIPDLIDTLASEMNPQVVCSVAGLCNNKEFLESVEENKGSPSSTLKPIVPSKNVNSCNGCRTVVNILEDKINKMSKDEFLQSLLMMCRNTGSFSDACSNVVLTYFTDIYNHMKVYFKPDEICILSGDCSSLFHTHNAPHSKNVQITPTSDIGFVSVNEKDDLPCQFCKQLVNHLRDLMVANTTEEEFKLVLENICKQTKSFSDECLALVDEYYSIAYQFLLQELNSTLVCGMVGICPAGEDLKNIPIVPLLPAETVESLKITPKVKKPLARVPLTKNTPSIQIISNPLRQFGRPEESQLPIDLLQTPQLYNKEVCAFCQFFLHYLQQVITSPKTEEEIRKEIEKACNELPSSVNSTCVSFVETYEDALVALLAQEIDPSQICPWIKVCPSEKLQDVDIFMQQENGDNTKCPLCLFAVQKLEEMVKDKKTESDIRDALTKLCSKLSDNLAKECQNFVDTYADELVEMLIADLKPKEVCVYLKLCTDNSPAPAVMKPVLLPDFFVGNIETNSISDNTFNGEVVDTKLNKEVGSVECMLCKVMAQAIENLLENNATEADILTVLNYVCIAIPGVDTQDCKNFVQEYTHTIIKFLDMVLTPTDICPIIQLCAAPRLENLGVEIFDCPVCEASVWAMEKILANPKVDHEMKHVLEKTCRALPARDQEKCHDLIEKYGSKIFNMIISMADKNKICREIGICAVGSKVRIQIEQN